MKTTLSLKWCVCACVGVRVCVCEDAGCINSHCAEFLLWKYTELKLKLASANAPLARYLDGQGQDGREGGVGEWEGDDWRGWRGSMGGGVRPFNPGQPFTGSITTALRYSSDSVFTAHVHLGGGGAW